MNAGPYMNPVRYADGRIAYTVITTNGAVPDSAGRPQTVTCAQCSRKVTAYVDHDRAC